MKIEYNHRLAAVAAIVASIALSTSAYSLSMQTPLGTLQNLKASSIELNVHPFSLNAVPSKALMLLKNGTITIDQAVREVMNNKNINSMIELRSLDSTSSFSLRSGTESRDYRFYVSGIPVCNHHMRAHLFSDRTLFVVGKAPDVTPYEPTPSDDWPDRSLSLENAVAALDDEGVGSVSATSFSKCLFVNSGNLFPAWNINLMANGLPFTVISDAYETFSQRKDFFDVSGIVRTYPANEKLTPDLEDLTIRDLIGDGTLTSTYLKTRPKNVSRVNEPSHQFIYNPNSESDSFAEASVFVHAQKHLEFFEDLGFSWYGPSPLEIRIHEIPMDNGAFIPASSASYDYPTILLGDGSGNALQNLAIDSDVVAHELGHHVVFKTLKDTSNSEAIVIHEALADFFLFAASGDPCLGESICPEGSTICWVEKQCLRTAATAMKYMDADYSNSGNHHRGQVLSGMLWDLYMTGAMTMTDLKALAFKTVDYLAESSGIHTYLLSLMSADRELFNSQYKNDLLAAAEERGLSALLSADEIKNILNPSTPSGSTSKDEEEDKLLPFCGINAKVSEGLGLIAILALLSPMFIAGFAYAPIKRRDSNRTKR